MYLANTGKIWWPGKPLSGEEFLSFGEIAEYEADRHESIEPDSVMTNFAHLILRGEFDAKPLDPLPFVDRITVDQSVRHLQTPLIGAQFDANSNIIAKSVEFLGYGCANSDDVLIRLATMLQWFEGAPNRVTSEDLRAFRTELLANNFETYPDVAQGFLNDTLIAKVKMREWYRLRGMTVPWPLASNDNDATLNAPETPSIIPVGKPQKPRRGRPPKSAWRFINRRSRELKREDQTQLNKVIATKVLDEAANEFCKDDLPAHSTVVKELSGILEGI